MKLAFKEFGQGNPVLLLHGLLGSGTNFGALARALAEHHRVICPDLRNHGESPHSDDASYQALAEDVLALINHLELPTVSLLGHSMGGKTAMLLACSQPARIARLLVADIAPVVYPLRNYDILAAMATLDLTSISSRAQADQQLQTTISDPGVRAFVLTNLIQREGVWSWRVNLPALQHALPTICGYPALDNPVYDGPVCFVYGTRSNYVLPEHHSIIQQQFPRVQWVPLEAGHWVHAEQPAAFLRAVQSWLALS